jgi:hypothetical protein
MEAHRIETSRLTHFLDNRLTDGGEVVSHRAIVWMEGLGQLKKSNDLIGNQTHGLLACSKVPQPTMLPHAPHS